MSPRDADITRLLNDLGDTDQDEISVVLPLLYDELRGLSASYLRQERPDHTLQATALVNEAYVRLADGKSGPFKSRAHFFRAAAKTMRHILINHAEMKNAEKRGGGRRALSLEEATVALPGRSSDVLAIDEALTRLAAEDPQKSQIVEMRFFAGCTMEEIAESLGVSLSTVERDWRFARAWLRHELSAS